MLEKPKKNYFKHIEGTNIRNIFPVLRAASPKYRLNQEIAKKLNFFKLAQNEAFRALVTKIVV